MTRKFKLQLRKWKIVNGVVRNAGFLKVKKNNNKYKIVSPRTVCFAEMYRRTYFLFDN